MSVLIKGVEMPTSEEKCKLFQPAPFRAPFCVINGVCHGIDACPLVDVPTPHGDLIGREWLIDIALHLMRTAKNDEIANGVKWLLQYIIAAPAIIQAEGEEM